MLLLTKILIAKYPQLSIRYELGRIKIDYVGPDHRDPYRLWVLCIHKKLNCEELILQYRQSSDYVTIENHTSTHDPKFIETIDSIVNHFLENNRWRVDCSYPKHSMWQYG